MLNIINLHASYGKSHVLQGISLQVMPQEICTLLGRNGAGKSTALKTIMGIISPTSGQVLFEGEVINRKPIFKIARKMIKL